MGDVWIWCLISTILFLILGLMPSRVVQSATERKRFIKHIMWLLLPIWIFYEFYLFHWSSISWVGELFTNFFTAAVVLYLQEIKQMDKHDCGLQYYGLFGIFLLAGWLVINLSGTDICSEGIMTITYGKFGVPIGVGLFIWGVNDGGKKFLLTVKACLKRLFRREKTKKLQEENKNENIIN